MLDTFRKSLEQVGALPLVTDAIVAKAKTPAMIRVTAAAFANLVISGAVMPLQTSSINDPWHCLCWQI